ncbi:hypothetical protein PI126_g19108 [Phytophthora idaei]|nr:hypothetical protein PI126_g19108 [Phytophthora idaei]
MDRDLSAKAPARGNTGRDLRVKAVARAPNQPGCDTADEFSDYSPSPPPVLKRGGTTRFAQLDERSPWCRLIGRTTERRTSARIRGSTNHVGKARGSGSSREPWSVVLRSMRVFKCTTNPPCVGFEGCFGKAGAQSRPQQTHI